MKRKLYHIVFFSLAAAWMVSCSGDASKRITKPDMRETYSKNDQIPFGTYIAYHQLENMYSRNTIKVKSLAFDNTWGQITDTGSLYVCISKYLYLTDEEAKAMLDFAYAGNTLFISSGYIDSSLLNQLHVKLYSNTLYNEMFWSSDSMQQSITRTRDSLYGYYYYPFNNNFESTDSEFTQVLGRNYYKKTNYMVCFHGKGKILLHCEPRSLSNYFLLKDDNYKYFQNALAYTNPHPDHIYWDDYYRRYNIRRGSKSPFSDLMSHPQLAAAFWLILLLLALYVLFGSKRRQRIVEKIKPNTNTSVAFTETIGRLYLQKKDNRNIADKMITYFNEHVRNTYFLNTSLINDEFITTLSRKSGVEKERVESLYRAIQHVHQTTQVDDYQLLSLNEQIQKFYTK